MNVETAKYTYPVWFRLLFLWGQYIIGGAGILVRCALLPDTVYGAKDVIGIVVLIVWIVVSEALIFPMVPTAIYIENNGVALARFWKYRRFDLQDVSEVRTNAPSPFEAFSGGWAKIIFRQNESSRAFYIAPYVHQYLDLLDRFGTAGNERSGGVGMGVSETRPRDGFVFAMRRTSLLQMLVGIPLTLLVAIGFSSGIWADVEYRPLALLLLALLWSFIIWLNWLNVSQVPVLVEFQGEDVVFQLLFQRRVRVKKSDVVSLEEGARLGRFRTSKIGVTVYLEDGKCFFIDVSFDNYPSLVRRLRRMAS